MSIIGDNIARFRKEKGLTQEELAAQVGVSSQSISKWENHTTMPDILLLPVLAGIFDVCIDDLFGATTHRPEGVSYNDLPETAYDHLLLDMQQTWRYENESAEARNSDEESSRSTKQYLTEHPDSQTAIYSDRSGAVYANADIGLIFRKPAKECRELLQNEEATACITALTGPLIRRILLHILPQDGVSYTAASLAQKCGSSVEETLQALCELERYTLVVSQELETEGNRTRVYQCNAGHKMLLIYAMLTLADRLAHYHEHYYGFRGACGHWPHN